MQVEIQSRSGQRIASLEVSADLTVRELKKKIHGIKPKLYPGRQRLTLPLKAGETKPTVLSDDTKALGDYGLANGSVLQLKDLGPQVGWAMVFFWEYFGPLVIYPLFYFFPHLVYRGMSIPSEKPEAQKLALAYWTLHFTKRILETFFVHRFGHESMPLSYLPRNCAYYWISGTFVGYFVNHPLYTAPPIKQTYIGLALALLCQLSNFRCHVILANLRKPGEKGYKIPRGFLFNYITCANYTCEIWGWLLFSVAMQSLPAGLFAVLGASIMSNWAAGKHRRLRKIFDGKEGREKYPRRWVILPPFF